MNPTDPGMAARRSRRGDPPQVPGFGAPASNDDGGDGEPPTTAASQAAGDASHDDGRAASQEPADALSTNTPSPRSRTPAKRPAVPSTGHAESYEAARSRAFTMHMLDPAREGLEQFVKDLGERGMKTNMTELIHALMLDAGGDMGEMTRRIKALRRARSGL